MTVSLIALHTMPRWNGMNGFRGRMWLWWLVGTALTLSAFPSRLGHIQWVALVCFSPIIVAISKQRIGGQLAMIWLTLQVLFIWLFAFIPPDLLVNINNPVSFSAIWLLVIVGPLIYTLAVVTANQVRTIRLIGPFLAGGIMASTELIVFDKWLRFPLTLGITVFDQPVMLQLAAWGGWVALSWLLWSSNFAVSGLDQSETRLVRWVPIGIVSAIGAIQTNTNWEQLAAIGTSPLYRDDRLQLIKQLTQKAHDFHPDLIVFPEAVLGREFEDHGVGKKILAISTATPYPILIECRITTHRAVSASATVLLRDGAINGYRHKTVTVPFIETPGTANIGTGVLPNAAASMNIGPLICFEILFDLPAQNLVAGGANLIIVQANTGYFGQSNWPILHAAYVPLRAVESGRTVVMVNDSGHSIAADPRGNIVWYSGTGATRVFKLDIPVWGRNTPFRKLRQSF